MKNVILIFTLISLTNINLYSLNNSEIIEEKYGPDHASFNSDKKLNKLYFKKNEVFKANRGTKWNSYPLSGGEMTSIAIDPNNPQIVYVGTRDAGVYKTTDGGTSWTSTRNGLSFYPIRSITVDPNNSGILYAGTDYDGIWKSVDSGSTWFKSSNGLDESLIAFNAIIDPQNTNILYTGLAGGIALVIGNIYKSTDGGANWELSDEGLTSESEDYKNGVFSITLNPQNSAILYVGTNYNGAFMSTDSGKTWNAINDSLPYLSYPDYLQSVYAITTNPHKSNRPYALIEGIEGGYYTFNIDNYWEKINQGFSLSTSGISSDLLFHPTDSLILYSTGLSGFYKSVDGGINWDDKQAGIERIAFYNECPDTIYGTVSQNLSVAGGVYKSINQGENWDEASNGITARAIRSVAIDPQNINRIYAGTGDGYFYYSHDGGVNWNHESFIGSEIYDIEVDHANSQNIYLGMFGGFYKSFDTGKTFTEIDEISNPLCIDIAPSISSVLFVGSSLGNGIYKTTNSGTSWVNKNNNLPEFAEAICPILSIEIDPNDTSIIWAGTQYGGGIVKSTNGGNDWINKGLTDENFVDCIAINPYNSDEILVGAGYSSGNIYKSNDCGESWVKKDSSIAFVFEIKYDPRNPQFVYAATEGYGVLCSTDGGETWNDYSSGIFYPLVYSLDIAEGDSALLIAGSYGSGIYYIHPELSGINEQKETEFSFLPKSTLKLSGSTTLIEFNLPKAGIASLKLYDIMGREVANILNKQRPAGRNEVSWNSKQIPAGIYFYNLKFEGINKTQKVTFIR